MYKLVIGNGYLAQAFIEHKYNCIARNPGPGQHNLYDYARDLRPFLSNFDIVVNTVGTGCPRDCIGDFSSALQSNTTFATSLAHDCAAVGVKLVHISTGCVYPSGTTPRNENDPPCARNQYLASKLCGEYGVMQGDPNAVILRPRMLFSGEQSPRNLLWKMANFASFSRVKQTITPVSLVVSAAEIAAAKDVSGIFNIGCQQPISIHDIAALCGVTGTGDYKVSSHKPSYTATEVIMDLTKANELGVEQVDTKDCVTQYYHQLTGNRDAIANFFGNDTTQYIQH